jgi:hypothetical protein
MIFADIMPVGRTGNGRHGAADGRTKRTRNKPNNINEHTQERN